MSGLFARQKGVDLVTVTEELKASGQLEEVGGAHYLATLTTVVPTSANIQHYVRIVREKAMLRHLITAATQIVGECFDSQDDVERLIDKAEQMLFEIANRTQDQQA